jgi:cyclin-dependent kinase regulatory subunit CKS1
MVPFVDMARRNKQPRMLTSSERERLDEFIESISYSSRYVP